MLMLFADITAGLFSWNKEHTVNLDIITEMSEYVEQDRVLILQISLYCPVLCTQNICI